MTVQSWPWKSAHVACSGLRAKRVAIVRGRAYVWRLYWLNNRWTVHRVRVASVDDHRSAGRQATVAVRRRRSEAIEAGDADVARVGRCTDAELDRLELGADEDGVWP